MNWVHTFDVDIWDGQLLFAVNPLLDWFSGKVVVVVDCDESFVAV